MHNFAASPADIPAGTATAGLHPAYSTAQTAEEIEVGREVGAQVAKELVAHIRSWGLPAVQAGGEPTPRIGDVVLMGYFESVDPGSKTKRLVLGFGSGAAELRTTVEAYQIIISSAAKVLGEVSGRTTIEGAAKRTAKEIADKLQVACQKQGWI